MIAYLVSGAITHFLTLAEEIRHSIVNKRLPGYTVFKNKNAVQASVKFAKFGIFAWRGKFTE